MILKQPYNGKKVDIWCLGILLYTMLSAMLPFDSHNIKKLKNNILSCTYKIHPGISFATEKLLRKIFTPAQMRISIEDIKET
jgi:serine/threonine protein kinase